MGRLLCSAIAVVVFFVLAIVPVGNAGMFVDVPTALFTIIIPLVYQVLLFGSKGTRDAFAAPFANTLDNTRLLAARSFFASYHRSNWCFGIAACVIGAVQLLSDAGDVRTYAAHTAITLISLVYAAAVSALVIIPFSTLVERRLAEK